MLKIQLLIPEINWISKYSQIEVRLNFFFFFFFLQYYSFYCIFDQTNAALMRLIKDFQKHKKKDLPTPKFWNGILYMKYHQEASEILFL